MRRNALYIMGEMQYDKSIIISTRIRRSIRLSGGLGKLDFFMLFLDKKSRKEDFLDEKERNFKRWNRDHNKEIDFE
jgi:hypothetical protein